MTTIQVGNIKPLLDYTDENYRPYDPGGYLYNLMLKYPMEEKFKNEFVELVYTTLIAWNMNQRAAKLSGFEEAFKKSLFENKEKIQSLEKYRLEELDSIEPLEKSIIDLFENLNLVDEGKPKLVTFSKTLHFFLPNLLMPIDRAYTILFFYNRYNFTKNEQIKIYLDVFEQFRQFAKEYGNSDVFKDYSKRWNKNIPKMIDNIIIAHISIINKQKEDNNKRNKILINKNPLTKKQLEELSRLQNQGNIDSAKEYLHKCLEENYTD